MLSFIATIPVWVYLAVLVVLSYIFEYNGRSYLSAFLAILTGVLYFTLTPAEVTWTTVAGFGALYLLVGAVTSFLKYRNHVVDFYKQLSDSEESETKIATLSFKVSPSYMSGQITSWIINWPIVAISVVLDNFVYSVVVWVKNSFESVYQRIYKSATDAAIANARKRVAQQRDSIDKR